MGKKTEQLQCNSVRITKYVCAMCEHIFYLHNIVLIGIFIFRLLIIHLFIHQLHLIPCNETYVCLFINTEWLVLDAKYLRGTAVRYVSYKT